MAMIQKIIVIVGLVLPFNTLHAQTQEGIATYYHDRFWGSHTSSGERYHPYIFSGAHRTIAFGTWVEVELLNSGKKTLVKINDRGPFLKGGVIDLAKVAAQELGIVAMGKARVRVRILKLDEMTDSLKTALFARDSVAKSLHPFPVRQKIRKKKSAKRRRR